MWKYIWNIFGTQRHYDQPVIIHIGQFDTHCVSWDALKRKSGLMTNYLWSFFVTEATCNLWSLNFTFHQIIFVWGTLYRKKNKRIYRLFDATPTPEGTSRKFGVKCLNARHWQQWWNNVSIFVLLINPTFRNGGFSLLDTLIPQPHPTPSPAHEPAPPPHRVHRPFCYTTHCF